MKKFTGADQLSRFEDQTGIVSLTFFTSIMAMDPRYLSLAHNLASHSTNLQKDEKALIHAFDVPEQITLALIRGKKQGSHSLRYS